MKKELKKGLLKNKSMMPKRSQAKEEDEVKKRTATDTAFYVKRVGAESLSLVECVSSSSALTAFTIIVVSLLLKWPLSAYEWLPLTISMKNIK